MSRYCPECKHNFSDEFDECGYCGSELLEGTIEIQDIENDKPIYEMSDMEILEKYSDYRKRIEEQTGHQMTDAEFLCGIKEARRDSLSHKVDTYLKDNQENSINIPKCPICQSTNIEKISVVSKAGSVAMFGIYAVGKVSKEWHCNNCKSDF